MTHLNSLVVQLRKIPVLSLKIFSAGLFSFFYIGSIAPAHAYSLKNRAVFFIAPAIEGLYVCDEGARNPSLNNLDEVNTFCLNKRLDGSPAIIRLLNSLEENGPRGKIQIGYQATLQLLSLYKRQGDNWVIDDNKVDAYLRLLSRINRPVVVYLAADHFDSQGRITDDLLRDPQNLMLLSNGNPPLSEYFGYRIAPYTLLTDEKIPVNAYRYTALHHVARKLNALPKHVRERVVAISLAGELHQLFPDFESGTGKFDRMQTTDYSKKSIAQFQRWLQERYGNIQKFNQNHSFAYPGFEYVAAPFKDIRVEKLISFGEHYDAYASGTLPVAGWIWDPEARIDRLDLFVDGEFNAKINTGLNRLDVYRAESGVTSPNVGYRLDLDYRNLSKGRHIAEVVGTSSGKRYLLGRAEFVVVPRDQSATPNQQAARGAHGLLPIGQLKSVKTWLDKPKQLQDVYYNPLARDWNEFRAWQVREFLANFYRKALQAGLPADKLYSHQILPEVNSSWNAQLFAAEQTLLSNAPWKFGVNLYGGATNSQWVKQFLMSRNVSDYGVPEFNPQQWKLPNTHLNAMVAQYQLGARFISPYYFSVVPARFKAATASAIEATEIRPDNPKEGSNQFYNAIRELAKH